jgi:ubiquinone/menaquinone biosynthesis C-methylase UbiE
MSGIESPNPTPHAGLTRDIRRFWSTHVNAERLYGKDVTTHARGDDAYYADLETQRFRSHRHLLPWIKAMTPGKSVLEIGSGVGLDTFAMAKHGLRVTSIDLTEVAVTANHSRFRRHQMSGSFAVADAGHLPFPNNAYDYVYSFGVLHHAADTAATIKEVYRVLKPGGQARIMLYHRRSLNELVHRLVRVPFEEKDALCPVVRRFTRKEVRAMFSAFQTVGMTLEYVYGEGYGPLFRLTPRWLHNWLSRHFGWHLMIVANK